MKMTISGYVDVPDVNKYLEALRAEVKRVFMEAGKKFLIAAVARIPVYTGMARGAFRNAEDLFGRVTADASSPSGFRVRAGQKGSSANATSVKAYYYPPAGAKVQRTPEAGRAFATPSDKIIDVTGASLASGRSAFYFSYEVNLTYVDLLDPAKWGAFKAASDALVDYVKANINLPDPFKFTTRKTIRSS